MHFRCLFALAICLATLPVLHAEPDKPAAPAADFPTAYTGWKQTLARLYQIQELYKSDPSADKKALQTEYRALMEKAQTDLPAVIEVAEAAYLAAPNKSKELSDFLMANLNGYVVANDYENAARVATMLTDNDYESRELNMVAGIAFFCSNDFEKAGKFLKQAKENAAINASGERYLGMVGKYKDLWEKEQALRQAEETAKNLPKVKLTTSKGDIVVVLFENEAPIATANFISLVEKKFYDGLNFHRVIADFMAQGGDPKGDGTGGPGYTIPCECYQENHRLHFRGSLSMAKGSQRDSGGSQFFFTFSPTPHLDGKHTVFGRVVEGMDVLAKLQRTEPGDRSVPDKIIKATVLSKRPHPYVPVTRPDKE